MLSLHSCFQRNGTALTCCVIRFRWAVCQLDVLQDCLRLPELRKALESLPRTLDETYSRILCNIPEGHSQDAIRILQWLTYSARPLRVEELAEIVAVNIDGSPWFDCEARFPDQQDVLAICSSLVTTEEVTVRGTYQPVRLAHFSVKEYLVSERIQHQATATSRYAIQEIQANQSIAATCLAYLLQFDQHDSLTSETTEEFPLAGYAAGFWMQHTRAVGKALDPIKMLILELCLIPKEAHFNCCRLGYLEAAWGDFEPHRDIAELATPLYYATFTGANELVRLLQEKGADVNAKGGDYDNALQAASVGGHEAVVQLLLEKGADVNAEGGHYGNALQAASRGGHEAVVQLLLEKGADVSAEGGHFGNALQAASFGGHEAVVQLLLEKGADVSAVSGEYGNALQAASCRGHETVVQLLLGNGADVHATGGKFGSALQAALAGEADSPWEGRRSEVAQLLRSAMESQAPPPSPPTAEEPTQLT